MKNDNTADPLYEIRLRFNSLTDMGSAFDAIGVALVEAGVPPRPTVDLMVLEGNNGEGFLDRAAREVTPIEEATVNAAIEQTDTPEGGRAELSLEVRGVLTPAWPDDDDRWNLTALLMLKDDREALLEGMTVKEAVQLLPIAFDDGIRFGGEVDPADIAEIAGAEPEDDAEPEG